MDESYKEPENQHGHFGLHQPEIKPTSEPTLSASEDASSTSEPPAPAPGIYPSPVHGVTADVPPLVPEPAITEPASQVGVAPQPVVHVLSPRGVEYVFMTIVLFTGASGLVSVLLSLVNGKTDFAVLSFPVAVLVVSVPVFTWLFLRLKQAELQNPDLKLDASKRRSTQFTQIVSFLVFFFTLIGLVTALFAKMGGQYDGSVVKLMLDVAVLLAVSGGILFYYWRDEHRLK